MLKSIYIGLPVANLGASTKFYETIGFTKNDAFSDETTATMVWSEAITFQLQTHDKFKGWVLKDVSDARKTAEVLLTLSMDTRDSVDKIITDAEKSGGKSSARAAVDMGWLYNRSFEDPDGHVFEAVWLDPAGLPSM